jgi:cystathionine beta-lyase/cystathionine gamma-synthase
MEDDGRKVIFVPLDDMDNWERVIQEHKPKVIFLESPSNPLADLADIRSIYAIAKQH